MINNENFIRTYKMPDAHKCQKIIEWFEKNKELQSPGTTSITAEKGIPTDKKHKDSTDISLTFKQAYTIQEFIYPLNFLWECVNSYLTDFEEVNGMDFTGIIFNIQKYKAPQGGYHVFHHERGGSLFAKRMLVWMMYLNTVQDCGETEFKYFNTKIKAEQGKVVLWPTDFTHAHRGIASPTEDKYILTGWYEFCD